MGVLWKEARRIETKWNKENTINVLITKPTEQMEEPEGGTDHDASEQTHPLAAVGVGDHVSVADRQERDGDEPHGTQEVTGDVLGIVVPTTH